MFRDDTTAERDTITKCLDDITSGRDGKTMCRDIKTVERDEIMGGRVAITIAPEIIIAL